MALSRSISRFSYATDHHASSLSTHFQCIVPRLKRKPFRIPASRLVRTRRKTGHHHLSIHLHPSCPGDHLPPRHCPHNYDNHLEQHRPRMGLWLLHRLQPDLPQALRRSTSARCSTAATLALATDRFTGPVKSRVPGLSKWIFQ